MEEETRKGLGRQWLFPVIAAVLFYVDVLLVYQPPVHYEASGRFPIFYLDHHFLVRRMSWFGGPAEYLAGFLAQSYCWSWLGSLVLTGLTASICWATDVVLRAVGEGRLRFLALVPATLILLGLHEHYNAVGVLVALLLALLGAAFYVRLSVRGDLPRIAVFLLLALGLYYVAGGAVLVFGSLCLVFELLVRRRNLPALVAFLSLEAIPYLLGTYVFEVDLADAFTRLLPIDRSLESLGTRYVTATVIFLPASALVLAVWRGLAERRRRRAEEREAAAKPSTHRSLLARLSGARLQPGLVWTLFVATSALVVALAYDGYGMVEWRVDYYCREHRWDETLREARRLPIEAFTLLAEEHANQALQEQGRMLDEMFAFPQRHDGLQFDMYISGTWDERNSKVTAINHMYSHVGDIDLQIGLVNEAEREAHEALAVQGEYPQVLHRLACINIIKGRPEAARILLNLLSKHMVHGAEARRLLARMQTDPDLDSDPEISRIRSRLLQRDSTILDDTTELEFRALLEANPRNRMAFDYLMAFHLLRCDLEGVVELLPGMRNVGYERLPQHVQEAILLYERETKQPVGRCGFEISPETLDAFAELCRRVEPRPGALAALGFQGPLAEDYGRTYFHYYLTGYSGVGRQ